MEMVLLALSFKESRFLPIQLYLTAFLVLPLDYKCFPRLKKQPYVLPGVLLSLETAKVP